MRIEDLRSAAAVAVGRKVHGAVCGWVVPGSAWSRRGRCERPGFAGRPTESMRRQALERLTDRGASSGQAGRSWSLSRWHGIGVRLSVDERFDTGQAYCRLDIRIPPQVDRIILEMQ